MCSDVLGVHDNTYRILIHYYAQQYKVSKLRCMYLSKIIIYM